MDATLGLGGHAEAFLTRFPNLRFVGLDRDPQALALAEGRLAPFGDRVNLVRCVYDDIADAIDGLGIDSVDGILFDLGVSSMQLDRAERGFAYSKDAPLDMRMDQDGPVTAEMILADYSRPICEGSSGTTEKRSWLIVTPAESFSRELNVLSCVRPSSSISFREPHRPRFRERATPPSVSSRLCASRSTRSSASWSDLFLLPSLPSRSAVGSS